MSIHTKLHEFQKLGISIKKDAQNPHFRSKYADLSEVISKIRKPLTATGITLIQTPGELGLTTTLYDADTKTEITGFLPYIGATDPQKLGSNLTYLRRYSLVTMLGLEDDDDDGNTATAKPVAKAAPKAPAMTLEQGFTLMRASLSLEELKENWKKLPKELQADPEMVALKDELKAALTI
jgi:hypothetical protein